jgi:Na+-transporting NADH:ubiquinone oxidoreductase subunit NqrE
MIKGSGGFKIMTRGIHGMGSRADLNRILTLIMCVVLAGSLLATTREINLDRYRSELGFSLDYPQGWIFANKANLNQVRQQFGIDPADSTLANAGHTGFILNKISSLDIKAAFFPPDTSKADQCFFLSIGPKLGSMDINSAETLTRRFLGIIYPAGTEIISQKPELVRLGIRKGIKNWIIVREPGSEGAVVYQMITVNGYQRSLTLHFRTLDKDLNGLEPVFSLMANSLKDHNYIERGPGSLPRWAGLLIILVLAALIALMLQKMINQNLPKTRNRHGHYRRKASFIPLMILVCAILLTLAYMINP